MASSELLTTEQAFGLVASWAATLASMARSRRSVADLRAVLEEIVPAVSLLDDAIQREREEAVRIAEETQECIGCGDPTRCDPGICEQCRHDVLKILRAHYWGPRAPKRP